MPGVGPHGRNQLELAHMVEPGTSPADAIVAGTANAARLLGLADDLGTLETGKIADLVAVAVDSLTDITALGDPDAIERVIQNGVIVNDLTPDSAADTRRTA
jgi:imidazolonepropionase-like amidohydrolase